jgi:MFS family permease
VTALRALLRQRSFRLLWSGQVISNVGDAVTSLALLITAQRLTGSTAAVAATAIAIALPQLLFGLLAGVMVDRWNRQWVMIASDLLRAALVLGFLAVTTEDRLWLLYVIAFVQSSVGTFFNPARGAFLPEILPSDQLLPANSLSEMSRVVAGVAGTAAAGVIAGLSGSLRIAFVVDAATFVASAALIARIPPPSRLAPPAVHGSIRADLAGGIRLVFGSRLLLGVVVAATLVMFGLGAVNVLLVPFVVQVLGVSETWFGALEAAQVTSMLLAGGALALLAARFRPTTLISVGLTGVGIVVAVMAASTHAWHLIALLFAVGWFVTPVQASVSTILQTEVPDRSRGRALASFSTMVTVANVASMALAGVAAEAAGIRTVLVVSGAIAVSAGLASAGVFRSTRAAAVESRLVARPL